jgi:cation diffusion facilitator CzcD-associated flavoprotein CzcO
MREESEVVIVGAGPSGLSVGACLRARGVPFVMLEREQDVGPAWRRHYDRLHLHTVQKYSSLPMMPWPDGTPTYPSRAEFVAYLEAYAQRFGLVPRFGEDVRSARREGSAFVVRTAEKEYRARALVMATGLNRVPYVPSWPGQESFEGTLVHSSAYKNGAPFRGKRALVVGSGNSGAEIALDLWEHGARPTMSVRGPVHVVPRDMNGIPSQITALFLFSKIPPAVADKISLFVLDRTMGDLSRHGFVRPHVGPVSQVVFDKRIPLIDVGTIELVKQGHIEVAKEVRAFGAREVAFVDGSRRPFDLVVLATGYRTGIADVLEGAQDWLTERGYPRHFGAPVPGAPGLYFIGFRNPLTGQLNDIALEAERIAGFVAKEGRS